MVVFIHAGRHASARAVAAADIERIAELHAVHCLVILDIDARAVFLAGLLLQTPENFIALVGRQALIVLLQKFLDRRVALQRAQRRQDAANRGECGHRSDPGLEEIPAAVDLNRLRRRLPLIPIRMIRIRFVIIHQCAFPVAAANRDKGGGGSGTIVLNFG